MQTLQLWMEKNGYTNVTLASELNLSYEYIYKIANGKAKATPAFKWQFAERFGFDEAIRVFGGEIEQVK